MTEPAKPIYCPTCGMAWYNWWEHVDADFVQCPRLGCKTLWPVDLIKEGLRDD